MSRPWRIEFPGACYHIINRGNYKRDLFVESGAAEAFERVLGEASVRFQWKIHAYVVMRNHFHLALEITEPCLSEGMRWLQGTWIRRYNTFRKMVGRPFQGRFKGLLVEPGPAFARVCHYIHLNPVRAGIVPLENLVEYRFGSFNRYMTGECPDWLVTDFLLRESGGLEDTVDGWLRYHRFLSSLLRDPNTTGDMCSQVMSRGWCVGGSRFHAEMRQEMDKRGMVLERYEGLEPECWAAERAKDWEALLGLYAQAANVRVSELPVVKFHDDKALLAALMKQTSSVSNGWLASRLQMGTAASVSQCARRYLLRADGRQRVELVRSMVKH